MSGLLGRFRAIVRAKMSRAMDQVEDPAEMLDYSYEKQMEALQRVRRGIADVATARARLQAQLTHLNEQTARLEGQARRALALDREDLARLALTRKVAIADQTRALSAQVEDLQAQQNRLLEGQTHLTARIEAFRTHKEVLKAQYNAAQAQVRIGEAASGLSTEMEDVQQAMRRAQDKMERLQARAVALDELAEGGLPGATLAPLGSGDDIDRELARLTSGGEVERELENMKRALPPPGSS